MKKTISTLAILASNTAFAMIPPGAGPQKETVCLKTYKMADKSVVVGSCNEAHNNEYKELKLLENGCAKGQVAFRVEVNVIASCMPPGAVQL